MVENKHADQQLAEELARFEAESAAEWPKFIKETRSLPPAQRFRQKPLKFCALATALALLARHACETVASMSFMSVALASVCGWFLADLISGLAHMSFDFVEISLAAPHKRSLAEYSAWGFQYHHAHPGNWLETDLLEVAVGRIGLVLAAPVAMLLYIDMACGWLSPFASVILQWTMFGVLLSEVTHAWAHGRWSNSFLVRTLQKYRIVISPQEHLLHHKFFDQHFCTVNGWANPVVDFICRELLFRARPPPPHLTPEAQQMTFLQGHKSKLGVSEPPFHGVSTTYRLHKLQEAGLMRDGAPMRGSD